MLTTLKISQDQVWGIWVIVEHIIREHAQAQLLDEDVFMDVFYGLQNAIAFFGLWEEISHAVYGQIQEDREST